EIASSPEGLLAVRAAHVPEAYATGADRISIAPDGGLHFHGRGDEIVKVEAARGSLVEGERQVCRVHEGGGAAGIFLCRGGAGVAGVILRGGSVAELAAVVVPSATGTRALPRSDPFRFGRRLREALASAQPAAGLPRRWRFVDRLPVDPLGKRRASDLAALFNDGLDGAQMPQKPTMPEVREVRAGADRV